MVQLKHSQKLTETLNALMFQFQNGTIKAMPYKIHEMAQPPFQFQNGTIKARPRQRSPCPVVRFQFQNGTIKAR